MRVGMIGLGRMGANMVRRFMRGGHSAWCTMSRRTRCRRWPAKAPTACARAHVLAAALFERFSSQGKADFQDRLLSATRLGFGGHLEKGPGA